MRRILFLLFLFSFNFSFSQNQNTSFTDSTLAVAISKGGFLYRAPSYGCDPYDYIKYIFSGTMLVIAGADQCTSSAPLGINYKVVYKGEVYYFKEDQLMLRDIEDFHIKYYNLSGGEKNTFLQSALKYEKLLQLKYGSDFMKALEKSKPSGILLINYDFSEESEYSDAINVQIDLYNTSKKTIKYIWFTLVATNPVGDRVIDRYSGTSYKIQKGVGPIEPEGTASYNFENVWFSKIIKSVKVTNIKIQYMDGSVKTVKPSKDNTLDADIYNYAFD